MKSLLPIAFLFIFLQPAWMQGFYFGADLSYVNEMEACGEKYRVNNMVRDPYLIFAEHGCELVRLRLWHNPSWYEELNSGLPFSDIKDVKLSISRAKAQGMHVLLDFHLSDNWADPSRQRIPAAWEAVADNLPVLKDSLYNYISRTLLSLHAEDLLPELVQIGNETNKGILLSPEDDNGAWMLDWNRNSQLFNAAIDAVRDVEDATGKAIKVALHIAGPSNLGWLLEGFWDNGVEDFDIVGFSYYLDWHSPASIPQLGSLIRQIGDDYPGKEFMIFETAYPWTTAYADNANNVLSSADPHFEPLSWENQKKWLVSLTQEMINAGAKGVVYWEPAWVSSDCFTQWARGSHHENAIFFDFTNLLIEHGGIGFMDYPYENLTSVDEPGSHESRDLEAYFSGDKLFVSTQSRDAGSLQPVRLELSNIEGRLVFITDLPDGWDGSRLGFAADRFRNGVYVVSLYSRAGVWMGSRKVVK